MSDDDQWWVVVCPACTDAADLALATAPSVWVLNTDGVAGDTTDCPRCSRTHRRDALRVVATAPHRGAACELRSRYLARTADSGEHPEDIAPYPVLEDRVWTYRDDGDAYIAPDIIDAAAVAGRLETPTLRETLFSTAVAQREGVADPRTRLADQLVEDRLASQRGTTVGDGIVDAAADPEWPREPAFDIVLPGETAPLADATLEVGPKVSDWGDDLIAKLLNCQTTAVASAAQAQFGSDIDPRAPRIWGGWLVQSVGVTALDGDYARGISRLALEDGIDEQAMPTGAGTEIVDEAAEIRDLLTSLVEPGGAYGGGIDALVSGAFAALTLAAEPPTVVVRFDAAAWADADSRTSGRAFNTLRALSRVADVHLVVGSPKLATTLAEQHDLRHEELHTAFDAGPSRPTQDTPAEGSGDEGEDDFAARVWDTLTDINPWRNGYGRLLVALPPDGVRYQSNLHDDPALGLSRSAISRYWPVLTDAGLLTKETVDGRHALRLTGHGEVATEFIDPSDGSRVSPDQPASDCAFTGPPHTHVGAVCRALQGREEGRTPRARSVEEWVTDTPPAEHANDWVRWLWGPDSRRDGFVAHQRYTAAARGTVSCVDARIPELDDPRITYLSSLDDEVLVLTQWGGPLATLARIVNALLSRKALSKCLNEARIGAEFGQLTRGDGTPLEQLDAALWDVIVDGMQHGWFGEEELHWDSYRDRISGVRAHCLGRLADVAGTDQWDERADLMRDLHGLFASATQLYRAAGYDVVVNIRCPDTQNIVRDEVRHRDFCDFWKHTVPKHAAYDSNTGVHSHYRQTHEQRPAKRRWRHTLNFDPDAPASDPTVQWVLTGRTATNLREDIERAIDHEVAERVDAGDEAAPYLDVDVVNGNSIRALKGVIRRLADVKGKRLADAPTAESVRHAAAVDRLARLAIAATGRGDRPVEGNPMALAEGLSLLAQGDGSWLSLADVEQACAAMAPAEFLPDVGSRAATRCVQALLASDDPLTASDLQARVDCAESTWERVNRSPASAAGAGDLRILEELGIIQRVTENGTTARIATLAPWWSDSADRPKPRGETPACSLQPGATHADVAYAITDALGVDLDYDVFAWPPNLDTVYQLADVEAWRAWVWGAVASGDEYKRGPPGVPPPADRTQTRLGVPPDGAATSDEQSCLPSDPTVATDASTATDRGQKQP